MPFAVKVFAKIAISLQIDVESILFLTQMVSDAWPGKRREEEEEPVSSTEQLMLQGNSWLTKGLFKSQPQEVTKSQGQKMCGKSFLLLFFL